MYLAVAGACAEDKVNAAGPFDLSQFASVSPVGINFNFTQDTARSGGQGADIITGIAVTASDFYICNAGNGPSIYDSGTEQVRELPIANTDGLVVQVDDISAITGSNQQLRDIHFDDTGQYLLVAGWNSNDLFAASYGTAADITSTLSSAGSISNPLGAVGLQACAWNDDGTKVVVGSGISSTQNKLRSYTCNSAYNLSSVTSIGTKTITDVSANGNITGVKFNDDGTKIFVSQNKAIREYALSTPYDVSTMGSVVYTLDLSSYMGDRDVGPIYATAGVAESIAGFDWSSDGRTIYVASVFGGITGISGSPAPPVILEAKNSPGPTPNTFPIFSLTY